MTIDQFDQEIKIASQQLIASLNDQIIKKDAEIADLKEQIKKLKLLESYSKNFSEMGQS